MGGEIDAGLVAEKAIEEIAENDAAPELQAPDGEDVSQFNEAMNAPDEVRSVESEEAAGKIGRSPEVQGANSLGDAILEGLKRVAESQDVQIDKINELVGDGDKTLTPTELMQLQFEILHLTLQEELTSKVADKTDQGVQTLFKNQG